MTALTVLDPKPAARPDHSNLPSFPLFQRELHPYLNTILTAGGGRIARCTISGLHTLCMVESSLYPYLLYLHYDASAKWHVPAILRTGDDGTVYTVPVTSVADMRLHLPMLERAHLQAMRLSRPTPAA